ncbi:MAG TPA: hypothetical protein VMR31_11685 [Myxococcota bacterium]|nr:hypothetical protein [Myxococcota bacterium]
MHEQLELELARKLARPVLDELRGLGVELALAEGRRIERVEELREVAQAQLDLADLLPLP